MSILILFSRSSEQNAKGKPFAFCSLLRENKLLNKLSSHKAVLTRIPPDIGSTFLLTPFHFTQIENSYNVVLTPRYAIFLCPSDTYNESFTGSQMVYDVTCDESIEFLYEHDIKMARMTEKQHLIGERHVLEKLLLELKNKSDI